MHCKQGERCNGQSVAWFEQRQTEITYIFCTVCHTEIQTRTRAGWHHSHTKKKQDRNNDDCKFVRTKQNVEYIPDSTWQVCSFFFCA